MIGGQTLSEQKTNNAAFCFLFKLVMTPFKFLVDVRVFNIPIFRMMTNKRVKRLIEGLGVIF